MIKQWTNVLGLSATPQLDNQFKTTRHQVFQDSSGKPIVEAYTVKDMDHGTPIDPGSGTDQCGTSHHDQYIISAGICSSFYIAKFWGL
jgi:poly(3-hydroxybutyrate) depolymerase